MESTIKSQCVFDSELVLCACRVRCSIMKSFSHMNRREEEEATTRSSGRHNTHLLLPSTLQQYADLSQHCQISDEGWCSSYFSRYVADDSQCLALDTADAVTYRCVYLHAWHHQGRIATGPRRRRFSWWSGKTLHNTELLLGSGKACLSSEYPTLDSPCCRTFCRGVRSAIQAPNRNELLDVSYLPVCTLLLAKLVQSGVRIGQLLCPLSILVDAPVAIEPASFNRPDDFSPTRPFVRYEMYVRRSSSLAICCKC